MSKCKQKQAGNQLIFRVAFEPASDSNGSRVIFRIQFFERLFFQWKWDKDQRYQQTNATYTHLCLDISYLPWWDSEASLVRGNHWSHIRGITITQSHCFPLSLGIRSQRSLSLFKSYKWQLSHLSYTFEPCPRIESLSKEHANRFLCPEDWKNWKDWVRILPSTQVLLLMIIFR